MSLLTNNIGELEMLERIVNKHNPTEGDTLILRLYDTNVTPAEGDTFGTYIESGGTGYAAIALPGGSWTVSTTGDTGRATYAQQTFTYTGGDTLYGYYITTKDSSGDTLVLYAEEFTDGPYSVPAGGGTVKVSPLADLN